MSKRRRMLMNINKSTTMRCVLFIRLTKWTIFLFMSFRLLDKQTFRLITGRLVCLQAHMAIYHLSIMLYQWTHMIVYMFLMFKGLLPTMVLFLKTKNPKQMWNGKGWFLKSVALHWLEMIKPLTQRLTIFHMWNEFMYLWQFA